MPVDKKKIKVQSIPIGWVTATEGVTKKMKRPASNALKISEDEKIVVAILPLHELISGRGTKFEGWKPNLRVEPKQKQNVK